MKDIKMKRFATMSLSAMMVFSTAVGTVSALEGDNTTDASVVTEVEGADNGVALQEATTYKEGVTVVADENSKSGYTAHFVYNLKADLANKDGSPRSQLLEPIPEDAEIVGVNLVGSFRLHSSYEVGEDRGHSLLDYQPGDFAANVHPTTWSGEWTFENLEQDASGNYTISVPMISGAHYYYYQINYKLPGEDQVRTVSVDDPKNVSPCRANEANSDSETGDITHSIVYGKYSEKQGSTPNLDYMTPYEGSNKGTVQYVEYKGTRSEHQDLEVYLPAGYDANRETPYRVIYLSHGDGGNETYWMNQPQGENVMDHMIAENPDQEAIVVSMDNTLYSWDYYQIGENVTKYIIPYMEANYNVSKEAKDRAFAGFSMGSMTTTYMAFHHADKFGYFGIFSGCNIGNATFKEGFQYDASKLRGENGEAYLQEVYENIEPSQDLLNSVIYTQAGNYDTAVHANGFGLYGAYETIRDWGAKYMPSENFIDGGFVYGSHDIYTWAQCLYNFAKDVVWSKEDTPDTPDQPTTPDQPENPSDTEKPSTPANGGQTTTDKPTVKPTTDTTTKVNKPTSSKVKTGDDTELLGLVSMMVLAGGTVCLVKRKKEVE
ncbi:alpha/beta hydrolase [Faecalibacillus sp. H12]|uniref:alpha/beta hydrolase n=1 Tax=Faecalibacillus sp. H12 TaxID=2726452 RepID=UPI00158558FD|nr:alpha/beta hydrolase-fold protein [Faecalibacillus sp. H12]NUO21807.1 hypothetical protein [Faecalibacillus sp. H12]